MLLFNTDNGAAVDTVEGGQRASVFGGETTFSSRPVDEGVPACGDRLEVGRLRFAGPQFASEGRQRRPSVVALGVAFVIAYRRTNEAKLAVAGMAAHVAIAR